MLCRLLGNGSSLFDTTYTGLVSSHLASMFGGWLPSQGKGRDKDDLLITAVSYL
jgi:hypothetical protein